MNKRILSFLSIVVIFLFSFLHLQPAFAHGDDARIEISAERLNPGSLLDIRGVGFDRESEIALSLVASQVEVPVGTVIADAEGVFLLTYTLPVDLGEGTYAIRGATEDRHKVKSPSFTVFGSADFGSADGELREEDDVLLAPMPTVAAGVPISKTASIAPAENFPEEERPIPYPYIWIAAGIGVVVISLLILKLRR